MTNRTIDAEHVDPGVRGGAGVRLCGEKMLTYDLTVITTTAGDGIAAAGGWLCDRVRAGWRVTVVTPAGDDVRGLTILGVRVAAGESGVELLSQHRSAAIALDARVMADEQIRSEVLRAVDAAGTEVTMWGESALLGADRRFTGVSHRLSAAARAFKRCALSACGRAVGDLATERFRSSALWYPLDGADMVLTEAADQAP